MIIIWQKLYLSWLITQSRSNWAKQNIELLWELLYVEEGEVEDKRIAVTARLNKETIILDGGGVVENNVFCQLIGTE